MSFDDDTGFNTADEHAPTAEPHFVGHDLVDDHGDKIGTITDVVPDDTTGEPAWVVVSLGLLHAEHFVPLEAAYQAGDGRLVLPFTKDYVKHSPRATRDHILERDTAMDLRRYYKAA